MRFKQIVPFVFYIRTGNVAASLVHGRRDLLPNILLLDLPGLHLLFMIDICGNEKFGRASLQMHGNGACSAFQLSVFHFGVRLATAAWTSVT